MPVKFKGSSLRPAPLVRYDKSAIYNATRDVIGYEYTFTLTGHILSLGSELNSTGVGSGIDMDGVLDGQEYIRNLFDEPGLLEIESTVTATKEIKAWATPQAVEFNEGIWVNRTDYSVTLSADYVEGDVDSSGLSETSERWSFSENPDGTESVTHDLSARGIHRFDSNGDKITTIDTVKAWIDSKRIVTPSVTTPLGLKSVYNLLASQTVDESELSVSLTESFTDNDEPYVITESKSEQVSYDPSYSSNVSYNVRIQGLELEADTDDAYTQAEAAYESLESSWNETVPYRLSSEVITRDYTTGAIDLNRTFTHNKLSNIIEGSIEESIDVNIQNRADLIAQINIPGKPDGPLFQDLNMQSAIQKTVNITGRMAPAASGFTPAELGVGPDTDTVITSLAVASGYIISDTETWNPITGEFSRSVTWTY